METRQTKNTRPQLTTAELEVLQERFEEQQILLGRQKEAFASEREKFDQEKKRLDIEREEEQRQARKELEVSQRTINELRNEVRIREDELRKWGEDESRTQHEYEIQEGIYREFEKSKREMNGLRVGNPGSTNPEPSVKFSPNELTIPPFTFGETSHEGIGPKLTFREALETVPYFDGYNMSVSSFARACRRAREVMPASSERNLTRLLTNRLRGRAQAAVEDEPCDNIIQLIDLLTSAFGSQKTINQYRGELSIIYIKRGEHILDYISRVKDLRSAIIDSERRECGQLTHGQLAEIDALTARSFCEGLPLEYRLQFQATCYSQPFDAFSTAKTIARRLELDKTRFEEPLKGRQGTEKYPTNSIGPTRAHLTAYRPVVSSDRYDYREQYRPEVNNFDTRHHRRDHHRNFNAYHEPTKFDHPHNRSDPREHGDYPNQRDFGAPRGRYPVGNYNLPRAHVQHDKRMTDPPNYGPPRNAYRRDQEPRMYIHNGRSELGKYCRYCKTPGHEIDECRKRQYNNEHPRREVTGNAKDPLGWKDAPRGDQVRQTRPINAIEITPEIPSGSQS